MRRYSCQHCSYSANTLGYLKIHYTRQHKGQQCTAKPEDAAQPVMQASEETKVYRCLSCDYIFGNQSDMKRHLRLRHNVQLENNSLLDDSNSALVAMDIQGEQLVMGEGEGLQVVTPEGVETGDLAPAFQMLQQGGEYMGWGGVNLWGGGECMSWGECMGWGWVYEWDECMG